MATDIPVSQMNTTTKVTLLTLPVELRLEIYEYLRSGPLALCPHPPSRPRQVRDAHPSSSLATLSVCHQIRREAIPVFYRSIYLGSNTPFARSFHVYHLDPLIQASVREASADIPKVRSRLNSWLIHSNSFPNLKHCKLFFESQVGWLGTTMKMIKFLAIELSGFQQGVFWPKPPVSPVEMKVTLYIKFMWNSFPSPPRHAPVDVTLKPHPIQHHQEFEFDLATEIEGKSRKELLKLASDAFEAKERQAMEQRHR